MPCLRLASIPPSRLHPSVSPPSLRLASIPSSYLHPSVSPPSLRLYRALVSTSLCLYRISILPASQLGFRTQPPSAAPPPSSTTPGRPPGGRSRKRNCPDAPSSPPRPATRLTGSPPVTRRARARQPLRGPRFPRRDPAFDSRPGKIIVCAFLAMSQYLVVGTAISRMETKSLFVCLLHHCDQSRELHHLQ